MKNYQQEIEGSEKSTGPPDKKEGGLLKEIVTGTVYTSEDSVWEFDALYWWKPKGFSWIHYLVHFGDEDIEQSTWEGWYPPPGWKKKEE